MFSRPPVMISSMAHSSARRMGSYSGNTLTKLPKRSRTVRRANAAIIKLGDANMP